MYTQRSDIEGANFLPSLVNVKFIMQVIENGHADVLEYLLEIGVQDLIIDEINNWWFPTVKVTPTLTKRPMRVLQLLAKKHNHEAVMDVLQPYVDVEWRENVVRGLKLVGAGLGFGVITTLLCLLGPSESPTGLKPLIVVGGVGGGLALTGLISGGLDLKDTIFE